MAETFASGIAENLLGKIASLARWEVFLPWGFGRDLEKLRALLTIVKVVLLDAEEKQAQSHELRVWLGRLKDFCYDAEDVLDELEYDGLRKTVLKQYGNTKDKARRFFSNSNPLVFRFKMGHKVKALRERLEVIAAHRSKFHLRELVDYRQGGHRSRKMTDSLLQMSNVIGRNGDKENILKFLLHLKEGETVSVIRIVGLGGMGKTTLAKMLFDDEIVNKHFDLRIWVCVSEIFEKKEIMVSMIKSLTNDPDCSALDPEELQRQIRANLKSRRFLLVLDDVWGDDRGKWFEFQELLLGGAVGSKVIVTTRNDSVANTVDPVFSHHLKGLSHEDCLYLFKKLAFREGEEKSHLHLMEIGEDIVKKCGGIPLIVKTMGTLLYSRIDRRYWESIRDSESWKLDQKENDILPKLIYYQLPSYLKLCFAMCSLYPKDHLFNSFELTEIWMGNGLLQSSNEQYDIEDIGLQYIRELYSRSFFQDFNEVGDDIVFKMHDLVDDLAMSISQSEYFAVHTGDENVPDKEIRHVSFSIASLDQDVSRFLRKENRLRTIVVPYSLYPLEQPSVESSVYTCIFASKYLRMLHPPKEGLEELPSSIGGLKHLRFLILPRNDDIKRLPHSFWKLHNLQFLDLTNFSGLEELPKDVRNLVQLRHLCISTKQKRLPNGGIGCLRALQRLNITNCPNLEYLFDDIYYLGCLRWLVLRSCGKLISLPCNLMYLNALTDLSIICCDQFNWTEDDIMDIMDIRLSLRFLTLHYLPQVKTLPRWFQNSSETLRRLDVYNCENFSSFPEWLQGFASLEEINIWACSKLVSMPEWMPRLTALKKLTINLCPVLSKRCKGEDWHKIAHVSHIEIDLKLIRP